MNRFNLLINKYFILLVFLAGIGLFQSYWMRDFAAFNTVYLPTINTTLIISGREWMLFSYIMDFGSVTLLAITLKRFMFLIPYVGADLIILAFYLNIPYVSFTAYGLVWNDLLYFVMIPSLLSAFYKLNCVNGFPSYSY